MSHLVETMAWTNEKPWHSLGTEVPNDLTPEQMLVAAGIDWEVRKIKAYVKIADKHTSIGKSALVRSSDNSILDIVSNDWNPIQNRQAFEFFNDFIAAGEMSMETAGSLRNGQIVWGLAKINESFELFGGDKVDSYLLFTNFHKFGFATDVRITNIRAVCNNTLTLALSNKADRMFKLNHSRKFDADDAKMVIGISKEKLAKYKDMAAYLGSKKYTNETIVEYFTRVFPVTGANKREKVMSVNAATAMVALDKQPGTEYAPGTFWNAFNAVTYMTDHMLGRNDDNRLTSAWYGVNKNLKTSALEIALEMAEAA